MSGLMKEGDGHRKWGEEESTQVTTNMHVTRDALPNKRTDLPSPVGGDQNILLPDFRRQEFRAATGCDLTLMAVTRQPSRWRLVLGSPQLEFWMEIPGGLILAGSWDQVSENVALM
ncbi:hypothetical protein B0H19DRAFT_1083789 [Mycena capillaripes]|nr:hypothetical protein B0H19DRAFT_1083789 [Mycena capillaripes]